MSDSPMERLLVVSIEGATGQSVVAMHSHRDMLTKAMTVIVRLSLGGTIEASGNTSDEIVESLVRAAVKLGQGAKS